MAKYIATTDGNWSTVGTWSTGTNTPSNHASTRITIDGDKYTDTFTAPNTTNACLGVIINISALATSGYSYVVTLQENTVDTAATKTIAVADLALGAYYVEFTTPYVFTSTTAGYYRFKVTRSGSGSGSTTVVSNSAGTLVAFQAVDNRNPAAAPTTGDDVWIIGPNETGTSTVTVDGTCLVGSLTDATVRSIYYMNQAVYIGRGGLLKWDTSASATLTCKGQMMVTGSLANKGELQIGTVASPYPLAYTAKLRFDPNGTYAGAGLGCAGYGRVQLHGYPITGTTNWKTLYASGAGSVADPMVVDDAVAWATGSEILVCTTGAGIHSAYERHQNELCDVTKVNDTTYSLVSKREIQNADFEGAIANGWNSSAGTGAIAVDATTFHGGKQSVKLTAGSFANTNIYQDIATNPGKSVTLKFWTRGDGTYEGRYQIRNMTGGSDIVATKATGVTGTTWTEVTETFTVPASCVSVRIYLHCPSTNTGIAYFDDVTATVDGLMYSHSDNARVLYMTRNVVMESISFKEGMTATVNSYISGDIDYDWVRINNAYGVVVGGYAPNGAWYQACDYSVIYNNQKTDACPFYYQYHADYNMFPETFTGNITYNSAYYGFHLGQINKTLIDCFSVYNASGGFYAPNGSATMTRCISTSDNRNNLSVGSAFTIGGSAILMTDCESQSTGVRSIITTASCTGKLIRFKSGTLAGNNAIYTGDLTGNRLFNNLSFQDCVFQYAIPTYNNLANNTTDSEWRVSNYNDTDNVDMVIKPMGYRVRTGTDLADTTTHSSGGYGVRFQPTSSTLPLAWEFNISTGNIQTYQTTLSLWVKINNAAYYAGVHQNPKLTVNYDNGTTATDTASDSTDWQQLSVSFTPTTTYGQITVTIDGYTDATTTNAYFYIDDMEIAYPSGYAVNLGKLDVWSDANPITPSSDTTGYLSYDWTQDPYVVHTEAQANALSGIALDYEDKTITVSESHSLTELYEYCKASARTNGVIQALSTKDGITYKLSGGWTLIQGANVDITGTPFLDLNGTTLAFPTDGSMIPTLRNGSITIATAGTITCNMNGISIDYQADGTYNHAGSTTSGTITLDTSTSSTVTAQFAPGTTINNLDEVNITVENAATVDITVNSIVAGSRIQIYNLDTSTEMYNEIVGGTSFTDTLTYTEDVNVRIRLMYVDGLNAYKWYTATATITSTGFNINAAQEVNTVYEDNNIDGSTVTECSVSGATIRIYVDDPDNTTTAQRIYNWYQYYLFTEAGIREQDGTYVTATDQTHYVFDDDMKIVNEDTSNPLNITGANIVPQTGAATDIFDLTNGASIALNFNRVEGFSYSSGSGLSTEEHDTLLAIDTAIDTNLDAKVSTVKPSLLIGGKVII